MSLDTMRELANLGLADMATEEGELGPDLLRNAGNFLYRAGNCLQVLAKLYPDGDCDYAQKVIELAELVEAARMDLLAVEFIPPFAGGGEE